MVTFGLINIKEKHVRFLKRELKKCRTDTEKKYIKICIKLLEEEFNPLENVEYRYDNKINEKLKSIAIPLHLKKVEINLLSYLFTNDLIVASRLAKKTKIDRAVTYRTLDKLLKMGIVGRTEIGVRQYFLLDKVNPFKNTVLTKKDEIVLLEKFKIE